MLKRKRSTEEQVLGDPWLWKYIMDYVVPRKKKECCVIFDWYGDRWSGYRKETHSSYWGVLYLFDQHINFGIRDTGRPSRRCYIEYLEKEMENLGINCWFERQRTEVDGFIHIYWMCNECHYILDWLCQNVRIRQVIPYIAHPNK